MTDIRSCSSCGEALQVSSRNTLMSGEIMCDSCMADRLGGEDL